VNLQTLRSAHNTVDIFCKVPQSTSIFSYMTMPDWTLKTEANFCEFLGFYSGVLEASALMGYGAALLGDT
jgi:hypothetical protein